LAGVQLAVPVGLPQPSPLPASAAGETRVFSNVADLLPLLPRLRIASGDRAGTILQLRYPETTFGRAPENDYRFTAEEGFSRLHCKIVAENNRFLLRDNGSTNGTFVNGNRIQEVELRAGDVIEMGTLQMEFVPGRVQ